MDSGCSIAWRSKHSSTVVIRGCMSRAILVMRPGHFSVPDPEDYAYRLPVLVDAITISRMSAGCLLTH
jgi:hypothetical protein